MGIQTERTCRKSRQEGRHEVQLRLGRDYIHSRKCGRQTGNGISGKIRIKTITPTD